VTLLREFKEFVNRGNVFDLAVGVVIGGAFGKIVNSLVEDVVMPPIGMLLGNLDFTGRYLPLSAKIPEGLVLAEARKLGPVLAWGSFVTVVLNFLIIALCVFLLIKAVNALRRSEASKPAVPEDVAVLREIRDLLKDSQS
jgi:large conductance mechanosensitive channel